MSVARAREFEAHGRLTSAGHKCAATCDGSSRRARATLAEDTRYNEEDECRERGGEAGHS